MSNINRLNINGVLCTTEEELELEIFWLPPEQQEYLRNDFRGNENPKFPPVKVADSQVVPTFAVDKDGVDQPISGAEVSKVTAQRVIWDTFGSYKLEDSKMCPGLDGVWNLNGTLTLIDLVGVTSASIDVYRSEELWFTVAFREVGDAVKISMPFSCDVDAYKSADHTFDLRLRIEPEVAEATAVISGSDEETAWGMTYLATLSGESPTG